MKRTVAVRGGKPDPTGVTYIGEGGLGVPQRVPDASRWAFQNGGFTMQGHHVTIVSVAEHAITTRFARLSPVPNGLSSPREPYWTYVDEHLVPVRVKAPK